MLKNERGSALVMVMFALVILSLLGTAIVNSSLFDFKLNLSESKREMAFYKAESGLDELKEAIEQNILQLHDAASRRAGDEFDAEITKAKANYEAYLAYTQSIYLHGLNASVPELSPVEMTENKFFLENGALKLRAGAEKTEAELWVKERYSELFASGVNIMFEFSDEADAEGYRQMTLLSEEKMGYGLSDKGLEDEAVGFYVKETDTMFDLDWLTAGDFAVIPVTARFIPSKVTYEDGKQSMYDPQNADSKLAEISARIVLSIPQFDPKVVISQKLTNVEPNVLWTKALAASGNIIVEGEATISGNIFAGGSPQYGKTERESGGVIIGHENAQSTVKSSLSVSGQIVTGGRVHIRQNDSKLIVSGTVYANELAIDEGVSNLPSLSVDDFHMILQEAVIKDDLELNGLNSRVFINKGYYGYSDTPDPKADEHKGTSGIVINDGDGISLTDSAKLIIGGDLLLAGVNYIDGIDYKTGESLSIKGNYTAYSYEGLDEFGGFLSIDPSDPDYEKFKAENIYFESYDPLILADGYTKPVVEEKKGKQDDMPEKDSSRTFTTADKSDYFYYAAKQEELLESLMADYKSELNFGKTDTDSNIIVNGSYYSLGAIVANGSVQKRTTATPAIEQIKREKAAEYETELLKFGNYAGQETTISGLVELSKGKATEVFVFDSSGSKVEVVIINTNSSQTIINGDTIVAAAKKSGMSSAEAENYRTATLEGMILSKGDIVIEGLRVSGSIISDGDIILRKNVTIVNDLGSILKTMYHSETLRNSFTKTSEVKAGPFSDDGLNTPLYDLKAEVLGYDSDAYLKMSEVDSSVAKNAVRFMEWTIVR